MDTGLIVTFAGVAVAGLAAILGVWMERDPESPKLWGWVFSGLILVATGVEGVHAMTATQEQAKTDAQLAQVLEAMSELAASGNNPALAQFVGAELAVQARANPEVVTRMEESVAAKGGDPDSVSKMASQGRRSAAGLAKDPPKEGEKPKLSAAMETHAIATGSPIAAALTPSQPPAELAEDVLDDALSGSTEAAEAAVEDAKAAVEDTLAAGAKAVDDTKAVAEAAAAETKAKADAAAAEAKARADAAAAEADKKKAEAEAAAAAAAEETERKKKEAEAQAKAAEEEARKQKEAADKKKKEAEQKKKEAEEKAKGLFGR